MKNEFNYKEYLKEGNLLKEEVQPKFKNVRNIYFKKYSPSVGGVEPEEVPTLVGPMSQEA